MSVLVVRGDSRARGAADRTTDDGAIPAPDFLADGGTDTAADGTPNGGVDSIVAGGRVGTDQDQSCKQKCMFHVSAQLER